MRWSRALGIALPLFLPLGMALTASAGDRIAQLPTPQTNYLLGCGGCHGVHGISNSKLVPDLRGQVGYFLNTESGRDYLVRLPNVAFFDISDGALADLMNFMVFEMGGSSTPGWATRYTAAEIAPLRKQPLNEIALSDYRSHLVETLIQQYRAPVSLRVYEGEQYKSNRAVPPY